MNRDIERVSPEIVIELYEMLFDLTDNGCVEFIIPSVVDIFDGEMARSTVYNSLDVMMGAGVVERTGELYKPTTGAGRPAHVYRFVCELGALSKLNGITSIMRYYRNG